MEEAKTTRRISRTVYYINDFGVKARSGIDIGSDYLPRFSANAPAPPGLFSNKKRSLHMDPPPVLVGRERRQRRDGKI